MTNGPPSSAAGSSKSPGNVAQVSSGSGDPAYNVPFASWPPMQPEPTVAPTSAQQNVNSQTRSYYRNSAYSQHTPAIPTHATKQLPTQGQAASMQYVSETRAKTPPPVARELYKHWDKAIRSFLVRANLTQTLQGLQNDMLVLNSDWEQDVIPKALDELQRNLQHIIDRVKGKKKSDDTDIDIESMNDVGTVDTLDDRKLEYASAATGKALSSRSSINKSISQFIAKTRSRNDASNRAEFLYTLAEKKRMLPEELGPEAAAAVEVSSCARVDAKPIDRDKQMKYDIAKNGEGPLTRTVKSSAAQAAVPSSSSTLVHPFTPTQPSPLASSFVDDASRLGKKRKFDANGDSESDAAYESVKRKGKGRAHESENSELPEGTSEQLALVAATAEKHPGLDERLKNIEAHLALRYVPTPPRTLLARLKFLEDHIVRLEKEYPPWAALHFNQPNRGWPAPPRATPVIVPPQLRSAPPASIQTHRLPPPTAPNVGPTSTAVMPSTEASTVASGSSAVIAMPPPPVPMPKSRRATSSLQQAVLDRLEVQRAMNELNKERGT